MMMGSSALAQLNQISVKHSANGNYFAIYYFWKLEGKNNRVPPWNRDNGDFTMKRREIVSGTSMHQHYDVTVVNPAAATYLVENKSSSQWNYSISKN